MGFNEALLLVEACLCAGFVFVAWKLDKNRLHGLIIIFLILIATTGGKVIEIFGHATNAGNVFYAAVFLATYFLIERWGTSEGFRAIGVGIVGVLFFTVFLQITVAFESVPGGAPFADALGVLFETTPRLALASLAGYAASQALNVYLYAALKRRFGGRHVWLRANVANAAAQALDSIIFFSVAFGGLVSSPAIADIILTGYAVKVAFMMLAAPLLYLNSVEEDERDGSAEITMRHHGASVL